MLKHIAARVAGFVAVSSLIACGSSSAEAPPPAAPEPAPATEPAPEPAAPAAAPAPAPEPPAPDPLEAGPDIYKKVFENESMRILTVTFKPGASIGMHRHPDHVAYALSAGKLRITPKGAAAIDADLKVGDAMFIPAQEHQAENPGQTEVKAVVVELRATGKAAPEGSDPVTVGPTIYKKVFENDRVRVLEITFKPGTKIGTHAHPDHAAYVIEGGKLQITGSDGKAQDFDLKAGDAMFLSAQAHSAANKSKAPIRAVVFELKPAASAPSMGAPPAAATPMK